MYHDKLTILTIIFRIKSKLPKSWFEDVKIILMKWQFEGMTQAKLIQDFSNTFRNVKLFSEFDKKTWVMYHDKSSFLTIIFRVSDIENVSHRSFLRVISEMLNSFEGCINFTHSVESEMHWNLLQSSGK